MATHNPDLDLLRIQLDSLREQTEQDWVCLISDDCSLPDTYRRIEERSPVMTASRSPAPRSGSASTGTSSGRSRWCPRRPNWSLSVTRTIAGTRTSWPSSSRASARTSWSTATSDWSTADGEVIADTYWSGRRNNHTNFASMLIANTVTGAASLFRREMLDYALPFPEAPGEQYHDHWLALVAMSIGDVAYVDRPLYDYVQHGSAVLGHSGANAGIGAGKQKPSRRLSIGAVRQFFSGWRSAYFDAYLRLSVLARVIARPLRRAADRPPAPHAEALHRGREASVGLLLAAGPTGPGALRPQRDARGGAAADPGDPLAVHHRLAQPWSREAGRLGL